MFPTNKIDLKNLPLDEDFKTGKRQDVKLTYCLKMGGEVKYRNQKTLSKVLKLDEKNQYGF